MRELLNQVTDEFIDIFNNNKRLSLLTVGGMFMMFIGFFGAFPTIWPKATYEIISIPCYWTLKIGSFIMIVSYFAINIRNGRQFDKRWVDLVVRGSVAIMLLVAFGFFLKL